MGLTKEEKLIREKKLQQVKERLFKKNVYSEMLHTVAWAQLLGYEYTISFDGEDIVVAVMPNKDFSFNVHQSIVVSTKSKFNAAITVMEQDINEYKKMHHTDKIKQDALKKLTYEERKVLGIK